MKTSAAPEVHPAPNILLVDDDTELRAQISGYLADQGFTVHGARDGETMAQILKTCAIDLVILDVMLPGEDGLSICRRLGASGPAVILLSALGREVDRIVGLELGADDYLPKPCNPRELLARVRAVLRRRDEARRNRSPGGGLQIAFGGFTLDLARRQLRGPNHICILLTGGEFALLSAFLAQPNQVLSRDRLIELSHGDEADVFDRAIDVQVSRLRRKIHAHTDREIIRTFRNAGYMLDASVKRI